MANGSNYQRGGGGNYGGNRGGGNRGGGQQTYPNSGALFPQQKKSQNSPDMTGNVVISEEVLDYILTKAREGNEVKLDLAGWRRQAQSGTNFISLKINIPYADRQQDNPQYRPQPNYQRRPQAPSREERDQYGGYQRGPQQDQSSDYAQQSRGENRMQGGGRFPTAPQRQAPQGPSQEDFEQGDRMPDFMRDGDDPGFTF